MNARLALVAGLATACLGLEGSACLEHRSAAKSSAASAKAMSFWAGPGLSGSWFTPSRGGEGFVLQVLADGSALAIWFTYPPEGSPAQQAWIYAQDGRLDGDRIRFVSAATTRGPRFGPGYDPSAFRFVPWGSLEFRFIDCNRGEVTWAGPAGWGSGTREITRLSSVGELECAGKKQVHPSGARTLAGLRQRSGAWFDPTHAGEGWQVEELADGRTVVYWFTYDERGEQAWTIGTSPTSGERFEIAENLRPVGASFGEKFDPARVRLEPWGRLAFDFTGCEAGSMTYASVQPAFGSGRLRATRLAKLAGTSCLEGAPALPLNGTWSAGATMPAPQSEFAMATAGPVSCAAGGLGGLRDVKCYDVDADAWTNLPPIPAGRDHGAAIVLDGDLVVTGGYRSGEEESPPVNGWRYRPSESRWEPMAQAPYVVASGVAVQGGFAYFGDVGGQLQQVNLRTLATRTIERHGLTGRDHSQVVAFQGEIWMIAGRDATLQHNATVSIYDPAADAWRPGPPLRFSRAGFAAAADDRMILVAGGERLANPRSVVGDLEGIAAGEGAWQPISRLPAPVHGFGGAIRGNAFYTIGGSRSPGIARNEGQVQVYRWSP